MRRLFMFFVMMIVSLFGYAQTWFGIDRSVGLDVGYSYMYNNFSGLKDCSPRHLFELDTHLYYIYIGCNFGSKDTGLMDYYWKKQIQDFCMKFGTSFVLYFNSSSRMRFTPYVGFMNCRLKDVSRYSDYYYDYYYGDYISVRDEIDYGRLKSKFIGGGKITYDYKGFEIGCHIDNMSVGFNVGYNVGL